jgi:acyl-CoA synthetase (AMP-forming)/AMP-acid ligase II
MLRDQLRRCAKHTPDKVAFYQGDRSITWSAIYDRVRLLSGALQSLGIGPGDRVALLSRECIEVYEHFFACMMLGAVRVGVNWRYSGREMLHVIRNSGVSHCIVASDCLESMNAIEDQVRATGCKLIGLGAGHKYDQDYEAMIAADYAFAPPDFDENTALLHTYTSGVTAEPKGVVLSHKSIRLEIALAPGYFGITANDVYLMPVQSAWVAIVGGAFGLYNTCTTVIADGSFEIDAYMRDMERRRCTIALMAPAMFPWVVQKAKTGKYDLSALRRVVYGSAPSTPTAIREVSGTLGVEMLQLYGMSEVVAWACFLQPDDHKRGLAGEEHILRASGRFATYIDYKVCDDDGNTVPTGEMGVIHLKGETVMMGYLNLPEETAEVLDADGWLKTNDIGRVDENGYVYVLDRRKFLINTGGVNVFPASVEAVISEYEHVLESAVVGMPHPDWGEAVVAAIVPRPGIQMAPDDLKREVMEHCARNLSKLECPKHVEIMTQLPRTITAKLHKRALQDFLREKATLPWKLS